MACAATRVAVQIPVQVFIGSLGQLFYLPNISQLHLYELEIMFLSHLSNVMILVRYLDAIKRELGKTCLQIIKLSKDKQK